MNAARKPVHKLTDRAKRYRANSKELRPPDPKQCGFCGRRRNVGVHHITGNESDLDKQDLMWACKRCNAAVATRMRAAGLGKLTRQFNAGKRATGSRRQLIQAYGNAIKVMRGEFEGDVSKAVQTIRSTPRELRSAFTARSWPVRRQIYGRSGRQGRLFSDGVPF